MDTREKIFIAAAKLFAEEDYYKVSVREICEEANVTKPSLYYYFKDKETLLEELIKDTYKYYYELKDLYVNSAPNVTEAIRGVAKLYIEFIRNKPVLIRFLSRLHFMNIPGKLIEMKISTSRREIKALSEYFAEQQKAGTIKTGINPKYLCYSFWGVIVVVFSQHLVLDCNLDEFEKNLKLAIEFWIEQFVIQE